MSSSRREKEKKQGRYADARAAAEKAQAGTGKLPIKLPKGMSLFLFNENKTYYLDVLAYKVGKGNPDADYDPDDPYLYYTRKYWVHKNVGVDEKMVCCPKKNWGEPCPICEFLEAIPREDRWGKHKDLANGISPKQRQLFALMDKASTKGVQILEMSWKFGLGEKIEGKLLGKDKYLGFYHSSGGRTLEVTAKRNARGGVDIQNIEMEEREDIADEAMDQVPCLDDMLVKTDYKTLKKMFEQGSAGQSAERNGQAGDGSSLEETKRAAKEVSDRKASSAGDGKDDSDLEPSDEEGSYEADGSDEEDSSVEEPKGKKGKSAGSADKKGTPSTSARKSRSDGSDVDSDVDDDDDSPLSEDDSSVEEPSVEEPKKRTKSKRH